MVQLVFFCRSFLSRTGNRRVSDIPGLPGSGRLSPKGFTSASPGCDVDLRPGKPFSMQPDILLALPCCLVVWELFSRLSNIFSFGSLTRARVSFAKSLCFYVTHLVSRSPVFRSFNFFGGILLLFFLANVHIVGVNVLDWSWLCFAVCSHAFLMLHPPRIKLLTGLLSRWQIST